MSSKKSKKKQTSETWSPGDFAWFIPNGEKRPQQGEIVKVNFDIDTPYAMLIMVIDSKYRTAKISSLGETSADAKRLAERDK